MSGPDRRPLPEPDGRLRVVVVELEMTAPQMLRLPPPAGLKLALLRAEKPTVSFYRYLYDAVGGPWLWVDRKRLSDEALALLIQDEQVEIYVLYAAGVPAGYAELDLRPMPDIQLAYFGLMPEFIGRGLGPWLLQAALAEAWRRGPAKVKVSTCNLDHPKALAVYQRAGFIPVARREVLFDPRV